MVMLIVAMDKNQLIGCEGGLLWNLPRDLKRFREITMGYPIVMGRKTHQSIGKALPGRENIVLTRDKHFTAPGCTVVHSIEEAISFAEKKDVFVIGGGEIYTLLLPFAQQLYVTLVHGVFEGDVHFPCLNEQEWRITSEDPWKEDSKNPYAMTFMVYERRGPNAAIS